MIPRRVEPARSVRIAIPAYTPPTADTKRSIIAGVKALREEGIELQDLDAYSCCYVDYARNILVERFLRSPASDLVFIDSDVGFEPDALVRLCKSERPLVAGIYPKKTEAEEYPVAPLVDERGRMAVNRDGTMDCEWMPTGFMRINRAVFESLSVPMFADSSEDKVGAYFLCAVRDGGYWGEDVEFCRLVREAGGIVSAFFDMNLRHVAANKTYRGNWGRFIRSQMLEAA